MFELSDLIEDVKQSEMSAYSMFSQKEIEEKRKIGEKKWNRKY